jgi:hypothetical protein
MWKSIGCRIFGWMMMGLLVAIASATSAHAQVRALVVTTTGQQHEGVNLGYRVDEREVAVRTGQHTEPRLPVDQVAMIQFAPPPTNISAAEIERQRAGEHLLVRRDGTLVRGRLIEAGHKDRADESTPYLVTFQTAGEELRLDVGQVSRIYLASAPPAGEAPAATPGAPAGPIRVPAQQQWTETGFFVQKGTTVAFEASGEVRLSNDPNDVARPAGSVTGRYAPKAPMPGVLAGALIGRIGNSPPFGIGNQTRVPMPATGTLFLGVNDDDLKDNQGEFVVVIKTTGTAVPRR